MEGEASVSVPEDSDVPTGHALVDRFHELLGDAGLARATHRHLVGAQRAAGLHTRGRPLSRLLRPRLVDAATVQRTGAAASVVAGALEGLAAIALQPGREGRVVRDILMLTPAERELVEMAARHGVTGVLSPHARLDGFLTGGDPVFVELNAHSPGGVISQETLAGIHLRSPAMRAFVQDHPVRAEPTHRTMASSLIDAWERGGRPGGVPRVAIVDWEDGLAWEFRSLAAELRRQRVPVVVCSPDDLRHDTGHGLHTRDRAGRPWRITVVHRRAVTADLLARCPAPFTDHPLVRGWAAGVCVMVNPLASLLAHKKSVLALLSDPRTAGLIDPGQVAVACEYVPWTRRVEPGITTFRDREVDLLPFARRHREELVLKPNDDYGGTGVVCGWRTAGEEWNDALERAVASPYVLQERVPLPTALYPRLSDGRMRLSACGESTDPYLYDQCAAGVICRVSGTALLNVRTGADLVPVFAYRSPDGGSGTSSARDRTVESPAARHS